MVSQNRQAARDKHGAFISFSINYKAEAEIDDVQGHLHRIDGRLFAIESMLCNLLRTTTSRNLDDVRLCVS